MKKVNITRIENDKRTPGEDHVKNNEPFSDKCLLLTCRMPQSIITKVISAGFPMVASLSPPTDQSLEMARENNLAMAGFVRANRMNLHNSEASFL